MLSAVAALHPEKLEETIAVVYHSSFVECQEVSTLENMVPVLSKIFSEKETKDVLAKV